MDQYLFFAVAAVLLATFRYGTYFYTIYLGETKPHAFSWLLWGVVTGVGALAQFDLESGPSAWALAFVSVSCLLIAFLAFFIGERETIPKVTGLRSLLLLPRFRSGKRHRTPWRLC
ncbi:MAG: hypothetical protein MRY79_04305 [Alphaproteobacteria bacterium]|nr:hypothetical protein [Alphaproteobacteria bacterium]